MFEKLDKIPLLVCIVSFLLLSSLGFWQVKRLIWKEGLIADLEERTKWSTVTPDEFTLTPESEFTPLKLQGEFLPDDFFLLNRSMQGKAGVNWLKIFADRNGKNILVNRGWLPFDLKDEAKPSTDGITAVQGIVRFTREQTVFMPDNSPQENLWFFIDLASIEQQSGIVLEDYYLLAGENEKRFNYPVEYDWQIDLPNDHLQYALTWFALALVVCVMGFFYQYQYRRDQT